MKVITTLVVSLIFAAIASAETEFPRGTFEIADLEQAKSSAVSIKKDLAFIYTDKATSCGLCQNAVAEYIDAVKSQAVIVHLDAKGMKAIWQRLPPVVQTGLKPGEYIPKIVVTDATATKLVASLICEDYKADTRKTIRELKKALRAE